MERGKEEGKRKGEREGEKKEERKGRKAPSTHPEPSAPSTLFREEASTKLAFLPRKKLPSLKQVKKKAGREGGWRQPLYLWSGLCQCPDKPRVLL